MDHTLRNAMRNPMSRIPQCSEFGLCDVSGIASARE